MKTKREIQDEINETRQKLQTLSGLWGSPENASLEHNPYVKEIVDKHNAKIAELEAQLKKM